MVWKILLFILAGIGLLAVLWIVGFVICFMSQRNENREFMQNYKRDESEIKD